MKALIRILLGGLAVLAFAGANAQEPAGEIDSGEVTYAQSVVMIRAVQQDFNYETPWKQAAMAQGVGSGFVISGKRILTNAHNVSNCKYIELKKQNFAKRYPAAVKFVGHDCDLAILEVQEAGFFEDMKPLELGGIPKANSTVQTCGFPMGGSQVSVTEGVVSRVEISLYSHTQADSHLVVQTDAAINPGNSGGPVLQDGRVVGVAFQGLLSADNIGYMVPTTVIKHFLTDIEDGKYDGFGTLGVSSFRGLHSKSYAEYLKSPAGQEGIIVLKTMLNSPAENILQPRDVVVGIGDYDIDNDGMIKAYGLTLDMSEAVEQKQVGEEIEIRYYRDGALNKSAVKVRVYDPVLPYSRSFDVQPRYVVFAGLTFVPVSRNFLETWGREWLNNVPFRLRYLFYDSDSLNKNPARKEYVVISEILPDEVNQYCGGFNKRVVESVNGVEIMSLDDLAGAFEKSDGHCVIKFEGEDVPLIMDYEKAKQQHKMILEKYGVPAGGFLGKTL